MPEQTVPETNGTIIDGEWVYPVDPKLVMLQLVSQLSLWMNDPEGGAKVRALAEKNALPSDTTVRGYYDAIDHVLATIVGVDKNPLPPHKYPADEEVVLD